MAQFINAFEIFKLLDKSNCRQCNEKTCLAFAARVFKGERQLNECPQLDSEVIAEYETTTDEQVTVENDQNALFKTLKEKIKTIDLSAAARRLGAEYSEDKLTLKVLGKNLSVDTNGNISTEIHVHSWIAIPVYNYIIYGTGIPVSGNWMSFRELKGGKTWGHFFNHQCEKRLKRIADNHTSLFEDMIHIFNGKQVENHYQSDISLVLHPLPKVPLLICYWKPEDGLESNLNLFFDSTAEDNLNIESVYLLGTGLVLMFEKIVLRHG
ncbi:MAG: DUF3786 domain-containing protein [Thermodesulfobacteriota bacterium]|nr:DUF3786 domain-containing protein [Thermodesulfobacteriota bacterium]